MRNFCTVRTDKTKYQRGKEKENVKKDSKMVFSYVDGNGGPVGVFADGICS